MKLVLFLPPGALMDKVAWAFVCRVAGMMARRPLEGPQGSRRLGKAQWEGLWERARAGREMIRPRGCRYGLGTDR